MSLIKTKAEIDILREGGRRLGVVLRYVAGRAVAGVTERELDAFAEKLIRDAGDEPAFLNYRPDTNGIAFPATLCVSVNDAVVHGIPTDRPLQDGDIVGLDLGIKHRGLFTDSALTIAVGKISKEAKQLIRVTREALDVGIKSARAGQTTGDIGVAIQKFVTPYGYGIVRELAGHGVGHDVHEYPFVPNYGEPGEGEVLEPGMVLALEPMFTLGTDQIKLGKDKFTYLTKDGSLSAHFEHTIVITESGPAEIITN